MYIKLNFFYDSINIVVICYQLIDLCYNILKERRDLMNSFKLALSNLIVLILVFIFNFLTGTGLINDLSQADISAMYPTKITPAGFAFSIWALIYTLVFISVVWMLYKYKDKEMDKIIQAISGWFILSSLANILWTVTFSYLKLPLSTLLIAVLLISLVMILMNLSKLNFKLKAIFPLSFGLYAGWVMIATVVNIAASLVQVGWNGFGISEVMWANIILIVGLVIVFFVTFKTTNVIIPLPLAWAYFAIFKAEDSKVAYAGIFILMGISIYQLYLNKFSLQKSFK